MIIQHRGANDQKKEERSKNEDGSRGSHLGLRCHELDAQFSPVETDVYSTETLIESLTFMETVRYHKPRAPTERLRYEDYRLFSQSSSFEFQFRSPLSIYLVTRVT